MSDINPYTGEPKWILPALENALNEQLRKNMEPTVECHGCRQPVEPQDALPLEFEDQEGNPYNVVFHRPPKTCSLDWAQAKLAECAGQWMELDAILEKVIQDLRKLNAEL